MAERPLREIVEAYFNSHVNERYDASKIANETRTNKASISDVVNIYFVHRLEPPTGHKRFILPPDDRSNPVSATQARGGLNEESSVGGAHISKALRHKTLGEYEYNEDNR